MKTEKIFRNMLIAMLLVTLAILSINVSVSEAYSFDEPFNTLNEYTRETFTLPEDFTLHSDNHIRYVSDFMTFEATVYNDYGYAADGTLVYEGMIAADPYVLPIGTCVYVEFSGMYSFMSGVYTVHDTGGAVCGNVIDIWVPWSENEMSDFGRRYVTVTVL